MPPGRTYLLLPRASANRVYGEAAFGLALGELAVLDATALGGVVAAAHRTTVAGVDHLRVETAVALDEDRLAVLANLSSLHALFEVQPDGELLRPVAVAPVRRQDEDVTTIQRYVGRTNEALTHLLVNLAVAAGRAFPRLVAGDPLRLLDPACGRGTTLNRAIVYGLDAVGVEHDRRDVEAYEAFLLGWLQDKRLKHEVERARLRKGRPTPVHRATVRYGAGKDRSAHRTIELVADDTVALRDHVAARSIDVLVCDLPYGVQHGSSPTPGALQRGPAELVGAALPGWREALRPGAGVALAWNRRTLPRAELVGLLEGGGLELVVPADDERFVHRVDRAIQRDVVVARRPPA